MTPEQQAGGDPAGTAPEATATADAEPEDEVRAAEDAAAEPDENAAPGGDGAATASPDRDAYLRLAADFENYRRRRTQELADLRRYGGEQAALAMLPVLDNLQRALAAVPGHADDDALVQGVRLVAREFESALERIGVTPIDAVGARFDPSQHEAVAAEDSADVDADTVVAEYQRGYRLHERVLRPAMVRIAHPAAR